VPVRVLVLGGTGRVGRLVVGDLARRGHAVTVLARDPHKAPSGSPARIVEGDALDAAAVDRAVAGQEAVIYALGPKGPGPTTLFSSSTRILLPAMARHGVRRLVAITGVGAGETKGHGGFLYDRILYPLFTRKIYDDKDRQETLIRDSALEWTIVRPASFRESRKPRGPLQAAVDVRGVTLRSIAPAEVAAFVVDEVESARYLRQTPFVGHP
jgi:putative NADH-flavin reductase